MSAGTLFVVATPIGNLEDITLRALRVLREVTVIAAEDTRRTAKLLTHFAIATPTISFHEHNRHGRIPQLLQRLQGGDGVALVTDAGTPGVSDPGTDLIRACIQANVPVEPVPGASASLTAAVASGFDLDSLTILSFPDIRGNARIRWFESTSKLSGTVTFFEAPHRIKRTLADAALYFGLRPIMLARELTKLHQEFLRGTASELLSGVGEPKGEYTVVLGPPHKMPQISELVVTDQQISNEFCHLTEIGAPARRDVVLSLAKKYGRPAREVYAAIERAKKPRS